MDSLSALATFVRAAEARSFTIAGQQLGSFTIAGQQLGLSSSAIGKAVARLEERLGVRLFNRNTRTITLTQEGQLFLESCRRIISEIKSVEQEFVRAKDAPEGRLRVSLPLIGAFMMPTLSDFMQSYPHIVLDMDFSDGPVDVIGGGYDVAIQTGEPVDSRLMSRSLDTYRFEIVGSVDYFARAGLPETQADLLHHCCLHYRSVTTGKLQRWPFERPAQDHDDGLPVTATASAVAPLISLVEAGFGVACLPDFAIQQQLHSGRFVSVLKPQLQATDMIRVTWPSSRFMSPKLRAFIDFLAVNPPARHAKLGQPAEIPYNRFSPKAKTQPETKPDRNNAQRKAAAPRLCATG